jgi:hypothetical protein
MTPSFFLLFWCVVEIVGYGLSLLLIAIFLVFGDRLGRS